MDQSRLTTEHLVKLEHWLLCEGMIQVYLTGTNPRKIVFPYPTIHPETCSSKNNISGRLTSRDTGKGILTDTVKTPKYALLDLGTCKETVSLVQVSFYENGGSSLAPQVKNEMKD